MFSSALRHIVWANKRSVGLMMLSVLSFEPIRGKRHWRCSTRGCLHLSESCLRSGAACLAIYTNLRKQYTMTLHALASAQIWCSYAQSCCRSEHLQQSEDTMHSGSACIGVCTNQGILCTAILHAFSPAPIRVELYTTVLHMLASVLIRGQYAKWTCMSWRLYQLIGCMHCGPERLGVCTNRGQYALCCCTCCGLLQ